MLALPTLEAPQLWFWSWHLPGSGPDAQDQDQLFMLAARPGSTGHGPPSPLPLHVALRASCPCAASCRRVLELSTLALSTQVALTAVVSGAGASGPDAQDPDPLCTWAARPDWSRLAKLCLLRVVP